MAGPAEPDKMVEHCSARYRVQVRIAAQGIPDNCSITGIADTDSAGKPVGKPRILVQHNVRVMELVAPE